ncbi:MAG: Zn-ribbon domain-containing OB-fold protein [Candidatus Micrarchaeia archaeon]
MRGGLALSWRKIPERYRLEGSRCETCGTNYFPSRIVCPKCRRKGKIVDAFFSGEGRIYSYTTVYSPPAGFELAAPYVLAIVELAEGPRLTSQIVAKHGEIDIGTPVRVVFRKIQEDGAEGLIHYGFKFKPVQAKQD